MPSLAVVVPACPALIPVVGGRTEELDPARAAALGVVGELTASRPGRITVIADAARDAGGSAVMDLSPYGLPTGGSPSAGERLPVEYAVGAWLLDEAGWRGERVYRTAADRCLGETDAVIVVADGSARRDERAPGFVDARARDFDTALASALDSGSAEGILAMDSALGAELMVAGLPALRWLARAALSDSLLSDSVRGASVRGNEISSAQLMWSGAPLGVGMWVARWAWDRSPEAGSRPPTAG